MDHPKFVVLNQIFAYLTTVKGNFRGNFILKN